MPVDAQYRINVEKICRYRIKAAQENLEDPEKVEELCNCGQVEELVIQVGGYLTFFQPRMVLNH